MTIRARVGRHTREGGRNCQNWPDDQQTAINLLNSIPITHGGSGGQLGKQVRSGICSDELYRAISSFEDKHFPGQHSGYLDPGGAVLKRMEELAATPAAGPIDFVTSVDKFNLPTAPSNGSRLVISKTTRLVDSNQMMFVGIVGDRNNVVKTVEPDVSNSVKVEDAGVIGGDRWFRLSRPNANKITIEAKDAGGSVVTSFTLEAVLLPRASGPKDFGIDPADPNSPNAINLNVYTPKDDPDYIDTKMTAIGYNIYLRGMAVYCTGMSTPIHVPNSLIDLDEDKAEPIDAKVYDTLDQANAAIRLAVKTKGTTPFAYYRGAGGAVIAPTVFSTATAPRTIATLMLARVAYARYVQREMAVLAISLVGGMVFRALFHFMFRAPTDPVPPRLTAPENPVPPPRTGSTHPAPPRRAPPSPEPIGRTAPQDPVPPLRTASTHPAPPRRAPPSPEPPRRMSRPLPPEPPAMTRLRNTMEDAQNKNPLRSAEVLTSPKVYRHHLTSGFPGSSYVSIQKEGALRLAPQGSVSAQYGEGVYAWPGGRPTNEAYIDIEVPAGTAVEKLDFGNKNWVRIVPPTGNSLPVKIVGTNVPPAQIEMGRKLVGP